VFGYFSKNKKKSILEKLEAELEHWISIQKCAEEKLYNVVSSEMDDNGSSLTYAMTKPSCREAMFQYLLHKQWVGYHAERLRQAAAALDPTVNFWNYTEKIETGIGQKAMKTLLNEFILEYTPFVREELKKENDWRKRNLN